MIDETSLADDESEDNSLLKEHNDSSSVDDTGSNLDVPDRAASSTPGVVKSDLTAYDFDENEEVANSSLPDPNDSSLKRSRPIRSTRTTTKQADDIDVQDLLSEDDDEPPPKAARSIKYVVWVIYKLIHS